MKKKFSSYPFLVFILIIAFSSSCQKYKKEIEKLNLSQDSIQQVVEQRNDAILEYVVSFNEIQNNLDSIKQVQKILDVNLASPSGEVRRSQKDQIIQDIEMINKLLEDNKKLVASLQGKLKNSNLKISELEQMLISYARQIEEKDAEIIILNQRLEQLHINISELNQKVNVLSEESQQKTAVIQKQTDEMNTAWYCFGSKEELIQNNVIEKSGGFIGLGKTFKIKSGFNHDYFRKVDIRNFSEIVLMVKKAQLISTHPENTYHYTGSAKSVENFVIDDSNEFWKASRYLVILVEP
jgi:hypothetical protein